MSNDHFVPRFYLRNFAADSVAFDRRVRLSSNIRLIHLASGAYVPIASIKGQCQRPNFYGFAEGLEAAFGELETKAADAIRRIIREEVPPPFGSAEHAALAAFAAFQRSRTEAAALDLERFSERFTSAVYNGRIPEKLATIPKLKIAISAAADAIPFADQLLMLVLINQSNEEFITSDNPLVAHNTYREGINHRGVLGWNCAGIQMFLPLSPRCLLMLFDGATYAVGTNRSRSACAIRNIAEIQAINALQILSAREVVYFRSDSMMRIVRKQIDDLTRSRQQKRLVTVMAGIDNEGARSDELIHQYERLLPISLKLSAIRIRRNMARVPLHDRGAVLRDGRSRFRANRGRAPEGIIRYPVRSIYED